MTPLTGPSTADRVYLRMLGERIRAHRKAHSGSLQAFESNTAQEFKSSVMGAYERGEREMGVTRLARLAEIFGVSAASLVATEAEQERLVAPADRIEVARIQRHLTRFVEELGELAAIPARDRYDTAQRRADAARRSHGLAGLTVKASDAG